MKNPKKSFYNTPTLFEKELLILSVESVFGAWEALEDAMDGGCNMELIAGSKKLEKTRL